MFKLPKKKIIGITGTMGSGKSQVGKILSEKYSVLDCDKVNAELLLPNRKGFEELKERKLIKIDEDGYLDKKQLSFDMFQDKMIKKEVENILHPLIFQEMNAWIENQKDGLVFIEMPLLFEIGAQDHFDSIWCVVTKRNIALERLTKYRHIDTQEYLKEIYCLKRLAPLAALKMGYGKMLFCHVRLIRTLGSLLSNRICINFRLSGLIFFQVLLLFVLQVLLLFFRYLQ